MLEVSDPVVEGDILPSLEWQSRFAWTETSFLKLVSRNILRRIPGPGDRYRIDFVGLISEVSGSVFVLPKVFDSACRNATVTDLLKVLQCIQRYERRITKRRSTDTGEAEHFFSEGGAVLNLFLSLLSWTRDHGMHVDEVAHLNVDPSTVDWAETLDRGIALHFSNGIAFADVFGREQTRTHGSLAVAQATALIDLYERLGIVSRLWISDFDPMIEICRDILFEANAGARSPQVMRRIILDADLHATLDHERALVSMLRQWLENEAAMGTAQALYGVNAFHVIWEDMCSVAFGQSDLSHANIAAQPIVVQRGNKLGLQPQRPDLLASVDGSVLLADAKWYRVWMDDYPGTSDVVKQLAYELSVSSNTEVLGNAFLVPIADVQQAPLKSVGYVGMEEAGVIDTRFRPIVIVGLQWDAIVHGYISGTPMTDLRGFIIRQRMDAVSS